MLWADLDVKFIKILTLKFMVRSVADFSSRTYPAAFPQRPLDDQIDVGTREVKQEMNELILRIEG